MHADGGSKWPADALQGPSTAVPESVLHAARAAFDALDPQAEVAALVRDSWDDEPGLVSSRVLTFAATDGGVQVVLTVPDVLHQPVAISVRPAPPGQAVSLHVHGQDPVPALATRDGSWRTELRPTGPVRIVVDGAGRRVTTAWVRL